MDAFNACWFVLCGDSCLSLYRPPPIPNLWIYQTILQGTYGFGIARDNCIQKFTQPDVNLQLSMWVQKTVHDKATSTSKTLLILRSSDLIYKINDMFFGCFDLVNIMIHYENE